MEIGYTGMKSPPTRTSLILKGLFVDEGVFRRVQPDEADCIEGDG
jgi:hypothetical protein